MNTNDTLFEDTTGHAVDCFDGILEEGIGLAYVLINTPESDWDIGCNWAEFQLMGVEVIAACAGKPSSSSECQYIVEWAAENPSPVDPETRKRMLYVIDRVIDNLRSDPDKLGVNPNNVNSLIRSGELMLQRVKGIAVDDTISAPSIPKYLDEEELDEEDLLEEVVLEDGALDVDKCLEELTRYEDQLKKFKPWWKFW